MTSFYEKQAAGINGLGVDDRFPWQGSFAPSGSWQLPNLSAQQQQPNMFQQQLHAPAAKADVAGIQGALQKFRKMGAFKSSIDKEALGLGALSPLVSGLLSGAGSTAKPTLTKQATDWLQNYKKQYPKYNWAAHAKNLEAVRAPFEGWSGAWKGLKGFYAPGQMSSEKREATQNYLMGKNKQYPLPKGSLPWHMRDTGDRTLGGFRVQSFEPTKPKPHGLPADRQRERLNQLNKMNYEHGRVRPEDAGKSREEILSGMSYPLRSPAPKPSLSAKDLTPPPVAPLPGVPSPPPSLPPIHAAAGAGAARGQKAVEQFMKGNNSGSGSAGAAKLPDSAWSRKRGSDNGGLIMNDAKFRNLMNKHAEQDNSTDSRSAVGESKITYKTNEDDHATGTDAWDSLSTYMKSANETFAVPDGVKLACDNTGLTPYQLAFAVRVHEANLSPQQIIDGVEKVAEYMGEEYAEELRDGLDKIASLDKDANWGKVLGWGTKALKGMGWLGGKAKKPVEAVSKLVRKTPKPKLTPSQQAFSGKAPVVNNPSRVAETANRIFEPAKAIKAPTPASRTGKVKDFLSGGEIAQTSSKINPGPLGILGGQGKGVGSGFGGAMRMTGGAMTGDEMTRGALGQDAPWWARLGGSLAGAAYGRAMPNMSPGARAAGNRAWWGTVGGEAGDVATRTLGLGDYNLSSYGGWGGFISPLMKGQNVPGTFGKVRFPQLAAANAPKGGNALTKAVIDKVGPRAGNLMRRGAYAAPVVGATAPIAGQMASDAGGWVKNQIGNLVVDSVTSHPKGKELMAMGDELKSLAPMIREAKPLIEQAKSFSGLADMFGGVQEGIDGLFDMIGMGEFTKDMNPIMKIVLLAGAGLSLHGLLSGSKGTGIGGLGAMAIPIIAQMVMQQRKHARGEAGAGQTGAGGGIGSSTTAIDAQSQKDQVIHREQARHAQEQAIDAARQPLYQGQGIPWRDPEPGQ